MKAFVLRSYGSPGDLRLTDVDRPVPGDGEVLVRVRATSVQPYDWHHMRGQPYVARLMGGTLGPRGPKIDILGADIAGQVEAVGANVTKFRPGDEVYGMPRRGGFAEYVCVREDELAPKPHGLSFEQAAAVPMAACTALLGLRDAGRIESGHKVLVNGASGGVGTFAVQLAQAFGAKVTGVCGPRNADLVRSIGAQEVIDYTRQDFTRSGQRYDLLLDNAGGRSAPACRRVLTHGGTHVVVGGPAGRWLQPAGHAFATLALGPFVPQRVVLADVVGCPDIRSRLLTLTELIEAGSLTPVIDRRYPFEQIPDAIAYAEEGHATGKIVITVGA
ncbi:NAD(P)-dependent alcohol dehydrogenase [Sphaerisporangium sp. NPDC005289]|uniref:NAD(P)-dependent alcohol dehydrogenase n=1 Tax=Sphaerisporangium sp. NPDC005289 TaxID=3155247 RepID=UPI0033A14B7E